MLVGLLVAAALAYYLTTAEERARFMRTCMRLLRSGLDLFDLFRLSSTDPFYARLREHSRWPLMTYGFVAVNVAILLATLFAGASTDAETLIEWGANVGPRTTNGERWRLLTSLFVHQSVLHLIVNVLALAQLGFLVERIAGRLAFTVVYLTAGVLGAIGSVAASPLTISAGATCAVFGTYGLLLAVLLRGMLHRADPAIPLRALKTLAPGAALFAAYYLAADVSPLIAKVGLCTGFTGGIVLTRRVADDIVRLRRVAALTAATTVVLLLAAMAVRVVADVRPDIAAIVALEEQTSVRYDAAVERFQKGVVSAPELARIIEQAIVPDLQRASAHVHTLTNVPPDHTRLVAETEEYLRLRHESWRLRAAALRRASMRGLKDADRTEQASLQVFAKVKSAVAQ